MRKILKQLLNLIAIMKAKMYNSSLTIGKNSRIELSARICGGGKLSIGDNCVIRDYAVLSPGHGSISIGNNCAIGMFNYLDGNAELCIGNDVHIGPHVCIYTANHIYSDLNVAIHKQGLDCKPVRIGDDVWIGSHAVILAGVNVGKGSVIAAGAVITKNIPEYSVVAGIPAKVIKKRNDIYSLSR